MKLSSADWRAVLEAVDGFHAANTRAELWRASQEGLNAAVSADVHDIAIVATRAPEEDLYFTSEHAYTAVETRLMLVRSDEHPVVAHFSQAGDCGAMAISQLLPLRERREREFYISATGG